MSDSEKELEEWREVRNIEFLKVSNKKLLTNEVKLTIS